MVLHLCRLRRRNLCHKLSVGIFLRGWGDSGHAVLVKNSYLSFLWRSQSGTECRNFHVNVHVIRLSLHFYFSFFILSFFFFVFSFFPLFQAPLRGISRCVWISMGTVGAVFSISSISLQPGLQGKRPMCTDPSLKTLGSSSATKSMERGGRAGERSERGAQQSVIPGCFSGQDPVQHPWCKGSFSISQRSVCDSGCRHVCCCNSWPSAPTRGSFASSKKKKGQGKHRIRIRIKQRN